MDLLRYVVAINVSFSKVSTEFYIKILNEFNSGKGLKSFLDIYVEIYYVAEFLT